MVNIARVSYSRVSDIEYHHYCEQHSMIGIKECVANATSMGTIDNNSVNFGSRSYVKGRHKHGRHCGSWSNQVSTHSLYIIVT